MDGKDDEKKARSRLGERNDRRRSEDNISEDGGARHSIVGEEGEGGSATSEAGDAAAFGSNDEGTGTTTDVPPRGVRDATAARASTNAAASVSGIERDDESSLLDEKRRWSSRRFLSASTVRRSRFDSSMTTRRTFSRNAEDGGGELRGNHRDLTHAERYSSATPRLAESPSSSPAAASDQSCVDGMAEVGIPTSGRSTFAPASPRTAGKSTTLARTGSGGDNNDSGGRSGDGSSIPPSTTSGSPDWVDQKGNVARSRRMMSRRGLGNSLAMSRRIGLGSSLANQKQFSASGMMDDVGSATDSINGVSPAAEPPRASGSSPEWVDQKGNVARRSTRRTATGPRRFVAGSLSKSVLSWAPSSAAAASSESAPQQSPTILTPQSPRKHSPARADEDSALGIPVAEKGCSSEAPGHDGFENDNGSEEGTGGISDREDLKEAEKGAAKEQEDINEAEKGAKDFGNGHKEDDGTAPAAGAGMLELDTDLEEPLSDREAAAAAGIGVFSLELDTDVADPLSEARDDEGRSGGAIVGPPPRRQRAGAGGRGHSLRPGAYSVTGVHPIFGRRGGPRRTTHRHATGTPDESTTADPERRESSERVIHVEATLVRDDEEEEEGTRHETSPGEPNRRSSASSGNRYPRGSSVVVVAAQRITKKAAVIDFQNRRLRWGLCALLAVFAALAAGLGVALSRDLDHSGASRLENRENLDSGNAAVDGGRSQSTLAPSSRPPTSLRPTALPTPSPTSRRPTAWPTAWPTPLPSSIPTHLPSSMPSPLPSSMPTPSWELLASPIDSAQREGGFGSGVSFSDDGNTLAISFRRPRGYVTNDGLSEGFFSDPSPFRVYFYTEMEGVDGLGQWKQADVDFYTDCLGWTSASVAVSGNGEMIATAFRGCGVLEVVVFLKMEFVRDEEAPSVNGVSLPVAPPEHDASLLQVENFIVADTTNESTQVTVLLSEEGELVVANGTHVLMPRDLVELTPILEGGTKMSMSSNGEVIAVDSLLFANSSSEVYGVKIYEYDNDLDSWDQIGPVIGHTALVRSTAMSADGSTVAVGASDWDVGPLSFICPDCKPDPGRVSLYRLEDGTWMPMGEALRGDSHGDNFGQSVSLSKDGMMIAVGAGNNNAVGFGTGLTRVYRYEESEAGGKWVQVSDDIVGEYVGGQFGSAVALSGNGTRVAIGAPNSKGGGYNAGRVSVFELG